MTISLKKAVYTGYALMIFFMLLVSFITIKNLKEVSTTINRIVSVDIANIEDLRKLYDCLLAQDLYEKRFMSLGESDAENLFWLRGSEFKTLLQTMIERSAGNRKKLQNIYSLHEKYENLFYNLVDAIKEAKQQEISRLTKNMSDLFNEISLLIKDLHVTIAIDKDSKINKSNEIIESTLTVIIFVSVISTVFAFTFAFFFSSYILRSIDKLKRATLSIKSGNFDKVPQIHGINEFAELAVSFKAMTSRLKELEQMNLDANPLTKLPGNLAIEKELLIRFKNHMIFSFCLIDIDNFKAYSDKYGYSKGSDVLLWLGNLVSNIVKVYGQENDFVGHIGGDDFVLISEPTRVRTLCKEIINAFDASIKSFYNQEDRNRGYIISVDRYNNVTQFQIMTLSIAILSNDKIFVADPREVAERIADLKRYAKTFPRSLYVCENRREE